MLVHELGTGAPVVPLHGTPSPATEWLPIAEVVARSYRVLIPDLPAYGRSTPPRDASIEAVGEEIAAMLEWVDTTTADALARELDALARSRDLRPELPALRSRVYARVGTLDRGCPPAWSEELAHLAPRGTLDIIPGCGHALLIEDANATIAAVTRQIGAL